MPGRTVTERIDGLRAVPLFADLPERSLRRVLKLATEFEAPAGHVLVEAKHEGSGLFVIEEGTVVVEAGPARFEKGPGDFVGELALLTPQALRTARVRAKTPVRCLAISRWDFLELVEAEPKIALHMLEALAARLAETAHA